MSPMPPSGVETALASNTSRCPPIIHDIPNGLSAPAELRLTSIIPRKTTMLILMNPFEIPGNCQPQPDDALLLMKCLTEKPTAMLNTPSAIRPNQGQRPGPGSGGVRLVSWPTAWLRIPALPGSPIPMIFSICLTSRLSPGSRGCGRAGASLTT